jgi:hypothetical protein
MRDDGARDHDRAPFNAENRAASRHAARDGRRAKR